MEVDGEGDEGSVDGLLHCLVVGILPQMRILMNGVVEGMGDVLEVWANADAGELG